MPLDSKPNLKIGVYRITHFLVVGETRFVCESDLIFINDRPYVVLEWEGPPENQHTAIKVELDPSKLHAPSQDGYTVYDGDVVDPRTTQ
jgi:hypothetical protein